LELKGLSLIKLEENTVIKPFDCGDSDSHKDLNDFLFNKAKNYLKEHLATTFIIESEDITYAYYSVLNDSLRVEKMDFASKSAFLRFLKNLVSHPKRHLINFPAIKIGRLAVNKNIQISGLGKMIVNNVIEYAINLNETCACKLITVDAYSQALGFYEKLGFEYFTESDAEESERQMFLDLTPIIKTFKEEKI
jgi:predicted GNAT family N-acyltransferase